MRLYDENQITNIVGSSGKFMYKPQNKKFSVKNAGKKKSILFKPSSSFFDDETIEFNDYDSNMLNRNMIKYLPTDSLRLELQMERAEKKLKKIDDEILTSKILQIEEASRDELLEKKKSELNKEIDSYKSQYRSLGFLYRVADIASDTRSKIKESIDNFKNNLLSTPIFTTILAKIPGYAQKQKLEKMNMLQKTIVYEINKSANVDTKKLEYLFLKKEELS